MSPESGASTIHPKHDFMLRLRESTEGGGGGKKKKGERRRVKEKAIVIFIRPLYISESTKPCPELEKEKREKKEKERKCRCNNKDMLRPATHRRTIEGERNKRKRADQNAHGDA